ncbi:MAG: RNA polymerase sigma factor [Oscillospiraceae bacterium]|nr:RNA polymerase sigma factor [Oscillospiraceae bacterium]
MDEYQIKYNNDMVDRHATMVYRLAYSATQNVADAEDIMQEVFLRFVKKNPDFADAEHEKAWFIRVTVNTAKSLHLSPWRKRTTLAPNEELPHMSGDEGSVCHAQLAEALGKLSKYQGMCIHLFYFEGYSIKEISTITKISESTVKSHLRRAKESLRKLLGECEF